MVGRQVLSSLAGGDDRKAAGARPVDHLGDKRRLVAVGEAVDDARLGRLGREQRTCERVGLDVHHHHVLAYSNCSYVCSLLRPEVVRDLDLPRHGLQVIPYESGATFTSDGGYFAYYSDHHALRRELARFSRRDADNYERYARAVMRQCRFIKPLLLRTAPDPVSNRPRNIAELLFLGTPLDPKS